MDENTIQKNLALFGSGLKKLRIANNLSQEELAARAGIDRSYLGAIERGEHNLALINILKIAGALQIKPYRLLDIYSDKQKDGK